MQNKEYKSMATAMQEVLNKDWATLRSEQTDFIDESTKAYGDSLRQLAKDRQMKMLSKKDRDNLISIAKLLDREKKEGLGESDTVTGDVASHGGRPFIKKNPDLDKFDKETSDKIEEAIGLLEELDQEDEDKVKEIIAMLKKASAAHAGQADDLQKALDEKLNPGFMDARTLAGKIITGEVKLLTVKQGSPGRRGTSIMATGKPSVMGAPPDSIYIDATGSRPRGSGLAIGFGLDQVKGSVEIKRDGSARLELK